FQAEDGIRDKLVTGVQTCALPICDELIRNPDIRFTSLEITGSETGSRLATQRELREMLLGLDFLRAHRVYVAHSQGRLYFTYAGGSVFSDPPPQPPTPTAKPGD